MSGMQLTAKRSRSHGRRGLAGRLDVLGADAQPYLGDAGAAQAAGRFVRQRQQRPLNGYGRAAVRRLGRQEVHRRVADEAADEVRGGPVVDGDRRVYLQDLTLLHHRDAVAQAERLHLIVGHVDDGRLQLLQQALELRAHLQAQQRVQVAQRLVHQQHVGVVGDGARQGHPLALAAAQLGGVALQQLLDVEQLGGRLGPALDLGVGLVLHAQAERDVLEDGHVREDRVALEDHRDAALAHGQVGHVAAAEVDASPVHLLQPGDAAQQGGLAAAARPQQDDELAVGDDQAHVLDRDDLAEFFAHVFNTDLGHKKNLVSVA